MARYLFAPEPIFNAPGGSTLQLASGQPFRLWTAQTGGAEITDCTTDDGLTALPRGANGYTADAYGQPPRFYGPNNAVSLWIDGGGPTRYQLIASDLIETVLTAAIGWLASGVVGGGSGSSGAAIDNSSTGDQTTWSSSYIASQITNLLGRADFRETVEDRIGAMVAAAGGSYDDAAGTIGLPSGATNDQTSTSTTTALSAAATKALITALLTRSDFLEAVEDRIGAMVTAAGGSYNDTASTISLPSGGSGSAAAAVGVTYVQPSELTYFSPGASAATVNAALAANLAKVRAKYFANPGNLVQLPEDRPTPLNLELNSQPNSPSYADGFTHTNDMPVRLAGWIFAPAGRMTSRPSSSSGYAKPAVKVVRRSLLSVQPTSITTVTLGGQFNHQVTAFGFGAGVLPQWTAGDDMHLSAIDGYEFAERAGFAKAFADVVANSQDNEGAPTGSTTTVHKGIILTSKGLLLNVNSYSLAALNTAEGRPGGANNAGLLTTLERRTLIGDTSNVTFVVQGDTATGQLVVDSLSGELTAAEPIRDYTGGVKGATIGTYQSGALIVDGVLDTTYLSQVWLRKINSAPVDLSGLTVTAEPGLNPGDKIPNYNRPDAVELQGCLDVTLDGTRVLSGLAAGLTMRGCSRVRGRAQVDNLPNLAVTVKNPDGSTNNDDDSIYGYGVRFIGPCSHVHMTIDSKQTRHPETSNAIGATHNQNAYTGAIDPQTCSNFWSYGPGLRDATLEVHAVDSYGQSFDLHEGAGPNIEFSGTYSYPSAAAKGVTGPDGVVIRGHGVTLRGIKGRGARTAVVDSGPAIASLAGVEYVNEVIDCTFDECQVNGYTQGGDAKNLAKGRSKVTRSTFRAAATPPGSTTGMTINGTMTDTLDVVLEGFDIPVSHNNQGRADGQVRHTGLIWDYNGTSSNDTVRAEDTFDVIEVVTAYPRIRPGTSTRPSYYLRNMTGNTKWRIGLIVPSFLGTNLTAPQDLQVVAGSPTLTYLPVSGGASGAVAQRTGVPTVTANAAAGTGATAVLEAGSTDRGGRITLTAGTSGMAAGSQLTLTYSGGGWATSAYAVVEKGSGGNTKSMYTSGQSKTGFQVICPSALAAGAVVELWYVVAGTD